MVVLFCFSLRGPTGPCASGDSRSSFAAVGAFARAARSAGRPTSGLPWCLCCFPLPRALPCVAAPSQKGGSFQARFWCKAGGTCPVHRAAVERAAGSVGRVRRYFGEVAHF